jgi:hypothetical protein
MADSATLASVKAALGVSGTNFDTTLSGYIDTVTAYMARAGVSAALIADSAYVIARGVNDIWNNEGAASFSPLFRDMVSQLALSS